MKRSIFKAASFALTLTIAAALLGGCSAIKKVTDKSSKEVKLTKTVKSKDNATQIQIPDSWKETADLNANATIQVADTAKEKYLIVISEAKSDFPSKVTISDYCKLLTNNMSKTITSAKIGEAKDVTINGKSAKQFEVTGVVSNMKAAYIVTIIETDKSFHQVTAWTMQDRIDSYRDELKKVASSFKEL